MIRNICDINKLYIFSTNIVFSHMTLISYHKAINILTSCVFLMNTFGIVIEFFVVRIGLPYVVTR